jgi:hypothetical protein
LPPTRRRRVIPDCPQPKTATKPDPRKRRTPNKRKLVGCPQIIHPVAAFEHRTALYMEGRRNHPSPLQCTLTQTNATSNSYVEVSFHPTHIVYPEYQIIPSTRCETICRFVPASVRYAQGLCRVWFSCLFSIKRTTLSLHFTLFLHTHR